MANQIKRGGCSLSIVLLLILILVRCQNLTSSPTRLSPEEVLSDVQAKVAQNRRAFYVADKTPTKNILLMATGGPLTVIPEWHSLDESFKGSPNYTRVIAKQEQVIRHEKNLLPTDRYVSAEETQEINLYSVAIIYALGEYFQSKGHNVNLYTNSWGSILVAEMYRLYSDDPFNKVLITVGRLDMPQEIVESRGRVTGPITNFGEDGVTIVSGPSIEQISNEEAKTPGLCSGTDSIKESHCTDGKLDPEKTKKAIFILQSMMHLQHDLTQKRYTELLDSQKFGKVIYYFGGKDQNTGKLSPKEIRFLTGVTATISEAAGFTKKSVQVETGTEVNTGTPVIVSRDVYTMIGRNGHATVKYGAQDSHSMESLLPDLQSDILASFAAPTVEAKAEKDVSKHHQRPAW